MKRLTRLAREESRKEWLTRPKKKSAQPSARTGRPEFAAPLGAQPLAAVDQVKKKSAGAAAKARHGFGPPLGSESPSTAASVSQEDAYHQVRDRLNEEFVDLGNKQLKNIARPMRVYSVKTGSSSLTRLKGSGSAKLRTPRRNRDDNDAARSGPTKLTTQVCVSAPGPRLRIETTEQATNLIDRNLPPELASLPRWTFARALLVEATRTGKSRNVNAASRQFTQALRNERWVDESRSRGSVRNK